MRVYQMTEQPYYPAWDKSKESLRVNLPNKYCEPEIAANIYHQHLDEWQLTDELGLDIFVNEHHATSTCLTSSCNITLGILARTTKKARLLALGFPIANRTDPVRLAEEIAMIDVISRGRLEMGFVKGVPYELIPMNSAPARHTDRFWEAHDVILKALTSHEGPVSWESENFQYRSINIWPRPWQQPHPPVWISANSVGSVRAIATRGHTIGTVMTGYNAKHMFSEYRRVWTEMGRPLPLPLDRLCYAGFVACGTSKAEGLRRADLVASYLRTNAIVAEPFRNPPGFISAADSARMYAKYKSVSFLAHNLVDKQGNTLKAFSEASIQDTIDGGLMFSGTPDDVYNQLVDFYDTVGGFGHFLMMGHAGSMKYADTAENLTLFAKEVMPRLKEYTATRRLAAE